MTPEKVTILVASDLFTDRNIVRHICEGEGFQVLEAVDGSSCLEALERSDGNISVVILNWDVPGLSSLDVLRSIKSGKFSKVPVIVLTSNRHPEFKQKARATGATICLEKPFGNLGLLTEIQCCLPKDAT